MDEKTARTKWCPHVRVNGHNRDYTRIPPDIEQFRCIASDCMMWKETTELVSVGENEHYGDCGLKRERDFYD